MSKKEKPNDAWKDLEKVFSFRRRYFGRTPLRPVHIKLREVRDERIYTGGYAVGYRSLAELAQYFQEKHCYDHHILKDRAFCHDALIYWWNQTYDTMELFATDGYRGSIFDVWFHQKLYLRCVVNECEGYLKGLKATSEKGLFK